MAYITSPVTGEEEKKEGTRGEKRGARSWFGSNSSVSTECPALPEVDVSVVSVCEEEYNAALVAGSGEREALFKLCYAKAHVSVSQSGGRDACIGMCESAATILEKMYDEQQDGLSTGTRSGDETRAGNQSMTSTMYEGVSTRELLYVLGVAHYRAGNLLKARKFLSIAMEKYPNFSQASSLKAKVDDELVADGLFGLGIVVGGATLVGMAIAAMRR